MIQAVNKMVDTRKSSPTYRYGNAGCPECGGVLYDRANKKGGREKFCKACPFKL